MMFRILPVLILFGLAACSGTAEAPVAADRNDVAADAVADVDAAMAEASVADRTPATRPAS